jgi:glycosyltransferase involved in cell wall biosynthesis
MRVIIWPSGIDACGYYRMVWAAEELARQGADVVVDSGKHAGPVCIWDRRWTGDQAPDEARVLGVQPVDADVVVFQRPSRLHWVEVIPHIQAQGVKVVVDMDDDYTHIQPESEAFITLNPQRNPYNNWSHASTCCRLADTVTVSTPGLARRYGTKGHAVVLPNMIPRHYLDIRPERADTDVRLGWSGRVAYHPQDLEVVGGVMQQVLDTHPGTAMHIIGDGQGVQDALRLRTDPTNTGRWVPFHTYAQELAAIDVGVVPLSTHPFNTVGKSWLKGLEMAALGIPFVASPTEDYRRLETLGIGVTARRPRDWVKHLGRLLASKEYRTDRAQTYRQIVVEKLIIEDHADRWWDAWTSASKAVAA